MSDDWERITAAIYALTENDSEQGKRYRAWWKLSAILDRELPHEQLIRLLRDIKQPLTAYLDPPPAPRMAIDEKPDLEIVALIAEVLSHLTNGDYDRWAIEEVQRWSTKMLLAVECGVTPGTPSDNAVRAFMRQRVAEWPDHLPAPSEAEDVRVLQRAFPGLTRNEARIVRAGETPDAWRRQGPRRPWGKVRAN